MRVLLATDAWEPQINGVVRTLQQVRQHGPSLGMDLALVTPDQFRNFPMPGYPEIRLAMVRASDLEKRMAAFRPDVVHVATEGPIGLAARRATLRQGLPLTTSYHTRFPEYLRARLPIPVAFTYALLRRFHNAADAILVSTPSLKADLAARGFSNLMHWSRGVDLGLYHPRTQSTVKWPRPVFLNVGRVAVEKNLEAFLALDLPGTKVIVGDGPQRAALQARFPEAVFLGSKTGADLAAVYRQADVFVFPSRTDTFGVVLLEALASGLPVAAYPVMGPKDVLADTGAGVLDEDLRAAALGCLSVDRQACLALADRYRWDVSIRQFRDTLALACRDHAARHGRRQERCAPACDAFRP
jgi:glycosyltransferase involved in cell wall biosynthesis